MSSLLYYWPFEASGTTQAWDAMSLSKHAKGMAEQVAPRVSRRAKSGTRTIASTSPGTNQRQEERDIALKGKCPISRHMDEASEGPFQRVLLLKPG